MTTYAVINLAALPQPSAAPVWSLSAMVSARLTDFTARMAAVGVTIDTTTLESDPAVKLQETGAYREGLIYQAINEAVLSTSLPWAQGADIDIIVAAYGTIRAAGEGDDSLKARGQLAWEALSQGGTYGGYAYKARSAAPADIADVAVYGPEVAGVAPGEVRIVVLGTAANGAPSAAALAAVRAAFAPRDSRKVNDNVVVVAATPAPYAVNATLILNAGADPVAVVAAQRAALTAFAAGRQKIGASVSVNNIAAALGSDNGLVYDVTVTSPVATVGGDPFSAPWMTGALIAWARRS